MSTILDTTADLQPLAALQTNPADLLHQLKMTHRAITLTVDDEPQFVLQEAAGYQRLLDIAAQAEEDQAIREGLEDMHAGRTRPIDEVFDEMRERYAVSR